MKLGKALATGVAEERPEITDEGPEAPDKVEESQAAAHEEVPAAR
ncbi:hypothetical protein ABZ920_06015 [Streptomyces sp. NPDC046831]